MEEEKLLPPGEPEPQVIITETPIAAPSLPGVPSQEQQQWGVVISIVIIVLMIVIGAFYAWGNRIAQERQLLAPAAIQ